ncbi:MAG TPA: dihydrofolate reductase family protein [Candidatus Nanopelagicaceae bacterium]|jgi:riboflavin biosynthesis pyrimidine reductase
MAVIASLVLAADGSSTLAGTSDTVTTPIDRQRFLARRRACDAILIGGNTARNERYERTPVPLVIISHTRPELLDRNSKAHWWTLSPVEAVARARWEFGSTLSIEGGIAFISELLAEGLISQLELSITSHVGGENKVDYLDLLAHFEKIETEEIEGTIFHSCTFPIIKPK